MVPAAQYRPRDALSRLPKRLGALGNLLDLASKVAPGPFPYNHSVVDIFPVCKRGTISERPTGMHEGEGTNRWG